MSGLNQVQLPNSPATAYGKPKDGPGLPHRAAFTRHLRVDELHPDGISIAAGVPALDYFHEQKRKSLTGKEKFLARLLCERHLRL